MFSSIFKLTVRPVVSASSSWASPNVLAFARLFSSPSYSSPSIKSIAFQGNYSISEHNINSVQLYQDATVEQALQDVANSTGGFVLSNAALAPVQIPSSSPTLLGN
jgi:hypothetical protein